MQSPSKKIGKALPTDLSRRFAVPPERRLKPSPPGRFEAPSMGGRTVIELSKGQELALATDDGQPLTKLQMGVGWDKAPTAGFIGTGAPDIDLDASAVEFAGGQYFDFAFYNNLQTRDGSVVHLGDNLSGRGEGDDEVLTVDLSRVYHQVDTIVFLVSSYQGHSLEWVNRAYCRLVGDDDVELARFTLTGGVPQTGMVMAKIFRDGEQWRLRAMGEGIAVKVPTASLEALRPFL
jgi:stress response protein SCP2